MIKSVKLSVIIPMYNSSKYIGELLNNLLYKQTFKDVEIICVNDGSTDNTKEIVDSFAKKDNRLKCINQDNLGAGIARNVGFKLAKGDYVIWLDSDDIYSNNYFKIMYETINSNDADIANCLFEHVNYQSNVSTHMLGAKNVPFGKIFSIDDFPNILYDLRPNPSLKIYKRSFINKYKLEYMKTKSSNDLAFALKTKLLAKKIICINEELLQFRHFISSDSISSNRFNSLEDDVDVFISVSQWLQGKNYNKSILKSYLIEVKQSLAFNFRSGYKKIFFDKFCLLIKNYPFNIFTNKEINEIFNWNQNKQFHKIYDDYSKLINNNGEFNNIDDNALKSDIFYLLNCNEMMKIISEQYPYKEFKIIKYFRFLYNKTVKRLPKHFK